MKEQLCLIVENQPNALSRIFRLLARYEVNIQSLSIQKDDAQDHLEIMLTTEEETVSQQFIRMLSKLIEVIDVRVACE
ncbi:MAG: ACT domain-containing protein [Sporomusaceae bacterium]|nr:ACT domain-containing protein [Sporomusaceae bacterium]